MFTNTVYTDFFFNYWESYWEPIQQNLQNLLDFIIINHHGPSRTLQNTFQHCFDRFVFLWDQTYIKIYMNYNLLHNF